MTDWATRQPLVTAIAALAMIALLRGQATYWVARGAVGRFARSRMSASARQRLDRGSELVQRWGLGAVPIAYLMVGFQTAILAAAGLARMRWLSFTVAQLPGALAWAAIYATVGLAAWNAALKTAVGGHLLLVAVVLLAVVAVAVVVGCRPSRRKTSVECGSPVPRPDRRRPLAKGAAAE